MSRTDILKALIGALLIAAFAYIVFIRPGQMREEAARSKATSVVAETQAKAAEETVRIIVDHQGEAQTIINRTEVTTRDILRQPGASASISPELHSSGVRALCLQHNRDSDPSCAGVLQPDGGSLGAR